MSFWDEVVGFFEDIGGGIADFFDKALSTIGNVVTNVLNDPLPTIATIALTAVGVPPQVTAAVRTAMQGGDLEDMLISVGTSYVGGQISGLAGEGIAGLMEDPTAGLELGDLYFDAKQDVLKELITGASGPAFMAAAKGASFDKILEATITGAVSSKVGIGIREELGIDPSTVDGRIYDNAIKAATSALLRGQDIATAVGGAIANTGLSAAIGGATTNLKETVNTFNNKLSAYEELQADAKELEENHNYLTGIASQKADYLNDFKKSLDNEQAWLFSKIENFNNLKAAYDAGGGADTYNMAVQAKQEIDDNLYNAFIPRSNRFKNDLKSFYNLQNIINDSALKINNIYSQIDQTSDELQDLFDDRQAQQSSLDDLVNEYLNASIATGQDLAKDIADDAIKLLDEQTVTADEARQAFESAGYSPTDAEINKFITGYSEADANKQIGNYVEISKEVARQASEQNKRLQQEEKAALERQQQWENEQLRIKEERAAASQKDIAEQEERNKQAIAEYQQRIAQEEAARKAQELEDIKNRSTISLPSQSSDEIQKQREQQAQLLKAQQDEALRQSEELLRLSLDAEDDKTTTSQEIQEAFWNAGYDPTRSELTRFQNTYYPSESQAIKDIQKYVAEKNLLLKPAVLESLSTTPVAPVSPPITFTPDVTETPKTPVDTGEPVIKREEVYPDFFSPPVETPEPPAAPEVPVAERVDIQPAEDTGAPDLTFTPGERQYETIDDLLASVLTPDYQPDFVETMPDEVYQEFVGTPQDIWPDDIPQEPIGTPQDIWPEDIPQEPEFVETMPDEVYQEPQIPESLDSGWPTVPGGGTGGGAGAGAGTPATPPSGTGQPTVPTQPIAPSVAAPQGVDLLTFLAALGMLGAPQQQQQQPQYKLAELPDYVPFEQILTPYADAEDLTQRGRYG